MIKGILVDDEPFILQGLSVLIDWEAEGYDIVATASNGAEALEYIKNNPVDFVVSDIKMPEMNGLELLRNARELGMDTLEFIMLSGYKDFTYAQECMKYGCLGYVLKPIDKDELLATLDKVTARNARFMNEKKRQNKMEDAYLARNIISLLIGKFDGVNVDNVTNTMRLSDEIRFVDIEFTEAEDANEQEEGELRITQRKMYEACRLLLGEDENHVVFDPSIDQNTYDVGVILCDYMYKSKNQTLSEYLDWIHDKLTLQLGKPIRVLVGKGVNDIKNICKSYSNVMIMKSLEGFRTPKDVCFYEDEMQIGSNKMVICKKCIDGLLDSIERNEQSEIKKCVTDLFSEIRKIGSSTEIFTLNIEYFLFQLIHIATKQDDDINQEEILHFISESSFREGVLRGSVEHLTSFATQYAEYLSQLRKNVSSGVLSEIEKEIEQNYMENLSLKELSKKYYINSSYLGQVFRKKYGMSFKEYLTNYRINAATVMLIGSDEKIIDIAEKVGYKDSDYFIRKFIEIKGCTPSKYRKNRTN